MPRLIIHAGTPRELEFELKPGANYLGRGFSNDFKIEDPSVSGNHVQIIVNGEVITVRDLGSTNGTFINRSQVKEGFLQEGQSLHLGGVEMVLRHANVTTSPAAPPPIPAVNGAAGQLGRRSTPPPPVTTVAAPPPPNAPAPALPAAVEGLVDPPPGKTACKFHRNAAGQWLCQKCAELYCSLCVTNRRTSDGPGFFCRKCGEQCVPVRVKFVPKKEKQLAVYSDGTILARCFGFGFGAAVLSAALWIGLSKVMGFDVPFIFCPAVGVLCGYSVKFASQDRPGAIFSSIAVGYCILGSVAGKVGMIFATSLNTYSTTSLLTSFIGLGIGLFLAWKFGGGDF